MEEKYLRTAAHLLSIIFRPFYVPTVGFIALFLFTYLGLLPMRYQVIIVGVVYLFTVVLPMLAIYFYQKVNGWSLRHLGHREKRIVPYAMTIASYITCLLLMYRMGIPRFMSGILVSSLLAIVICALVNIWWKISVHMAAIGQFIGGMVSFSLLFYYDGVGWFCLAIIVAGLLGTSRIILRQHSLSEVIVGFLVGLVCGIAGILFI